MLENNLDIVESFFKCHQLSIAPSKCLHLSIKRKHSVKDCQYSLCDSSISSSFTVKDLSILISYDLKWASHISQIKSVAATCSYHILKCFSNNI